MRLPYHVKSLQKDQVGTIDDRLAIHGDLNSVESVTLVGGIS